MPRSEASLSGIRSDPDDDGSIARKMVSVHQFRSPLEHTSGLVTQMRLGLRFIADWFAAVATNATPIQEIEQTSYECHSGGNAPRDGPNINRMCT